MCSSYFVVIAIPQHKSAAVPVELTSPHRFENAEWAACDIFQSMGYIVVKVDLPNMIPTQDFLVQCDSRRLLITGERKSDISDAQFAMQIQRPTGKFEIELELPAETDTDTSEQVLQNGVLTVKFPVKYRTSAWRTLDVAIT